MEIYSAEIGMPKGSDQQLSVNLRESFPDQGPKDNHEGSNSLTPNNKWTSEVT